MNRLYSSLSVCKRIWQSEWRRLLRTSVLPLLLLLFVITSGYALYYGRTVVSARTAALDSLRQDYDRQYQTLLEQLRADTATPKGKAEHTAATHPAVIDYRLHRSAYHPPVAFSGMATGISDIARNYYPVTIKQNYVPLEEKINNPMKLLSGNFDLSFLLIYLLPLMAIALSYNLLSQEKEQGTLSLLVIQRGTVTGLLLVRLLLHYGILMLLVLLATLAGLLLSPPAAFHWQHLGAWMGVTAAYTACWMAVIWLVLSWNASSAVNLVTLLGVWLLIVVLIPAVCQFIIARSYAPDNTAANASRQREIDFEAWEVPQRQLLDSFYVDYPQYRNARAYDTSDASMRRGMAYFQLVEKRMGRVLAPQEAARMHDMALVNASYRYNPAVYTQSLLNSIARNDVADYDHFRYEATQFHTRWKEYFYDFHFHDRLFTAGDYAALPAYVPAYDAAAPAAWRSGTLYLAALSLVLLAAGIGVLWKKHVHHTS